MESQVPQNAQKRKKPAGIGISDHWSAISSATATARASSSQNSTRRHGKTSKFIGVKLRGKASISIELRLPGRTKRITAGNFTSQEQAAMAHDLARRFFIDEAAYCKLGKGKLNFWEELAFLIQFSRENGMDKFDGKVWDTDLKDSLRALASKAFESMNQMIIGRMDQTIIDRGLRSGDFRFPYDNSRESVARILPAIPSYDEPEIQNSQDYESEIKNSQDWCGAVGLPDPTMSDMTLPPSPETFPSTLGPGDDQFWQSYMKDSI